VMTVPVFPPAGHRSARLFIGVSWRGAQLVYLR
jgi:hypothetical protein